MFKNSAIYHELLELNSLLADISNENVFTVPHGYFASFPTEIFDIINNKNLLNNLDKSLVNMDVPAGYFDGLADDIMNKIKSGMADAEEVNIDFIAPARQQNVFKVPERYFDDLPGIILKKVSQPAAKVIAIKPASSIFRYALAAAFTGLLGLTLFSTLDRNEGVTVLPSTVTVVPVVSPVIAQAGNILKNDSFDKEMATLNEDEIISYLKNDGEDVNAALVASVSDDKSLPNEDAYYTDDKALDNVLNDLNITYTGNN